MKQGALRASRAVDAGGVQIGGGARISIQSMTNTETWDVPSTVLQIQRLADAGCDIVRVSVYDQRCVKAIPKIKSAITLPLVGDIHFDYRLAIGAMENGVDKIRFNPGNIGSEANVRKLADCARAHKVPVRIGVNAGSIEKEIRDRFGGVTPEAMVESALKHVKILEGAHFEDMVVSIKASDVRSTVAAYRLMHARVDYPLHIGVTEAGTADEGLIKSAIGLGALLLDGIGDTLRVSLTGDPVNEVRAAKLILRALGLRKTGVEIISCPTCGRCKVDLLSVVERVQNELEPSGGEGYLKAAVMGCVVNGPGEAKEADIGIAFGEGGAVVFKNGERVFQGNMPEIIDEFIKEAKRMLSDEGK